MEKLIKKYEEAKQSQIEFKKETPLTNAAQHQLLDQNIHLLDAIIKDLRAYGNQVNSETANCAIFGVSGSSPSDDEIETAAIDYRDNSDAENTNDEDIIEVHWHDKQDAFIAGANWIKNYR